MPTVEREVTIARGAAEVFDYVADPGNALRWMHNFTRFDSESPVVGRGSRVQAAGTLFGFPIATELEIDGFERPGLLSSRTTGRIRSRSIWRFADANGTSRVSFRGEYDLPGALLRMIGVALVQRELEIHAERSLSNLKQILEGDIR
jgi:uncharacterized membrane protein